MSTLYTSGGGNVSDPEEQGKTWEFLNEELRLRSDAQRKSFERIEGRAAIVLGASFAALQFVAREPARSGWLPFAVAAYGLAMAFSLIAVLPRGFEDTKPRSLIVGLWLSPRGRAAAELANERLRAFELNVGRQAWMVRFLRASVALAIVGAILSTAHLTKGERTDVERRDSAGCASGSGRCDDAP